MQYEDLIAEAERKCLVVEEAPLEEHDGLCYGNMILINRDLKTAAKKACVLAEEIAHHDISVGNIIDMTDTRNRKQERAARLLAYDKQIGLRGIVKAYEHHCQNQHEMADYLGVTEEFLEAAIECYREKYGRSVEVDNYTIYLEPGLAVLERYK